MLSRRGIVVGQEPVKKSDGGYRDLTSRRRQLDSEDADGAVINAVQALTALDVLAAATDGGDNRACVLVLSKKAMRLHHRMAAGWQGQVNQLSTRVR